MAELVELGTTECLDLFCKHEVGRVAFCTPRGPRIVPVNYTVYRGDIFLRTTPFSELGTYGRDVDLAFEVDEVDMEAKTGCSAVAIGHSEAVEDPDEVSQIQADANPIPWAGERRHLYIRLRTRELTGRRIRR